MSKKARINLIVPQSVKDRIERLMLHTDSESITDVIKRSLAVLDALVEIEKKGGKLIVEQANGEQQRLILI